MPEDRVRVAGGAYLVFRHPSLKRRLHVTHGATEIRWSYNLNTVTTPTYGGEVVQVLSAYVGPMTITGQTANNDELQRIYDWFLDYMTLAGKGDRRDERAIIMEYPERGWNFKLQITQLPNFQIGTTLLGTPWQFEAEVVNDDAKAYLVQHTMNKLNQPLFNATLRRVGFNPQHPSVDPTASPNRLFDATTLGDNMQRLLPAWSSGDFGHWGFDALRDPDTQFTQSAKDYWMDLFGTEYITGQTGGRGGSSTFGGIGDPRTEGEIVAAINAAFEAKNVPGALGVAVAMQESGLNPNSVQVGCNLPQCGIGLFQVNGDGSGGDSSLEVKRAGQHRNEPGGVTKYYPAGMQISRAAERFASPNYRHPNLGEWAYNAQRPADHAGYVRIINGLLPRARQLIERYKNISPTINPSQGAKAMVDAAAQAAAQFGTYVVSAYRPGSITSSGNLSDHASNDADQAARDIAMPGINAITGPPSPNLDRAVAVIGQMFGRNYGSGKRTIIDTFIFKGYRVQIIWRTPQFGGHMGHIHLGIRRS